MGVARRFLVQLLEVWDLQGLEYDASVVLSELVTNAVLHARTDVHLRVSSTGRILSLEVSDGSPKLPMAKRANPRAATGKGLVLIDALATAWGVRREASGKTIWANFAEGSALETSEPRVRQLRPRGRGQPAGGGTPAGNRRSELRAAS